MAAKNLAPNWFNLTLFQKILDNYSKDGKVTNFNILPATKEGDHIGGNVLRANINYLDHKNDSKEFSIIIKYFNELSDNQKIDKKYKIELKTFETEYKMYTDIIPKFEKMLRAANDKTLLGPRLYYASENPNKILVLEDLKKSGYEDFPNKLADDKMAETAIDKLAKWHACSYKLHYENADYFKDWDNSVFKINEDNPEIMCGGPKCLIKVLKPIAEKCLKLQEIIDKLEKIDTKLYKKCSNIYEYSKTQTKLNVLNHGDFHIKNLMFTYNDDKTVQDAQIIDFALCFWSSMALDLIYILYAIYDGQLRNQKRDEIIYTYFKKFENCLKSIGFKQEKIPKFQDLLYDLNNLGYLDVWMSTTFLPYSYAITRLENSNIEKIVNEENYRFSMYKIPDYLNDIKVVLKRSLNYGFLDESYYE